LRVEDITITRARFSFASPYHCLSVCEGLSEAFGDKGQVRFF
jgi:hypothetical protein